MRRGVLVLLPGLIVAGAIANVAAACSSFEDAPGSTSDASDASSASDGTSGSSDSSADGTSEDAADAGQCTAVRADFAMGKVVPGFAEVKSNAGTVEWNQTEGALTPGSLEAISPEGGAQAQIERDFPLGKTTRARLAFSARLKSIGSGAGRTSIGCTLQLTTEAIDGDFGWIEIIFKHDQGQVLFDQDSHGGGSSINATPYANASDQWTTFELELSDIRKATAKYRARVGTTEIPLATADLPSPPDHFHIKCGIDSTMVPADVLTDDIAFEMCE